MRHRASGAIAASAALAATVFTGLASAPPALADTTGVDVPSAVEDGAYPGAAQILAEKGITLTRGDGGITLADCTQPSSYQIKVLARTANEDDGDTICFAAPGAGGYLAFTIPDAYRITTYNRSVRASLSTDQKPTETTDVPANGTKGIGETLDPNTRAVLLELRVTGSTATPTAGQAADAATAFTTHLAIGDQGRTCTGALVAPQWVLTAKSCFADDPANPATVTAGAPKNATTATLGRADIHTTGGHRTKVIGLVPHADRDLVMARLETPVYDIAPLGLSSTAPADGGALNTAGYGRTATAWTPGTLHTPAATTGAVTATGFDLTPTAPALICKGDAGAPLWRTENNKPALAGVITRAWQGGCLGTPAAEARTTAHAERTDNLAGWVSSTLAASPKHAGSESGGTGRVRYADWDGDGRADLLTVADSGAVHVYLNRGGDGHGGWEDYGQVATGMTTDKSRVRFADWDGDGRADYIVIQASGAVGVFLNKGGDGHGGWQDWGQVATGLANADQVRFADWDGDGKADYIVTQASGAVGVFLNKGGDGHGGWQDQGAIAQGVTSDRSRIRFADIDGDGKVDYNIINSDGSVTTYINKGGDGHGGWTLRNKITSGATTNQNIVHFADLTGEGNADYLLVDGATQAYAYNGGDDLGGAWIYLGQIAGAL
ncbi:FG-GAP-like repeat-containing protein [Kitasatospora cineracea]|uniref:VCBS repeat protein n=1 Tax=Kitasatospora cineracea TaxID=88074 RepID=A0A8G1UAE7_9ACTN|nr:FG-GAP-like repeat-containing protein [Kitasatospora cineracea]ROR35810.1 VCBS repeat protein [Kitasatospora cineracea]